MTGSLAGFENDQFVHLSQAQQVLFGEQPTRDFVELGMPLTVGLSAAAQAWGGRTLLSELSLTTGILALCTVLLFLFALRLSRSYGCALVVALLQVAMAPRFYNHPKLLAYALAMPALWFYVDRPGRRRAWVLGVVGAIAFLLRHDHGAYVALGALVAIVVSHRLDVRRCLDDGLVAAAAALVCCLPYLVLLQSGRGVATHFYEFGTFASRAPAQTNLKLPSFALDWSAPLYDMAPAPVRSPGIHVRWKAGLPAAEREAAERQFEMTRGESLGDDVWSYRLGAWDEAHIAAIVRSPLVVDTQGVSRRSFTITDEDFLRVPTRMERMQDLVSRARVLPGLLREENAVPFLYYLFVTLPVVAALLAWRGWSPASPVSHQGAKLAVLVIVACAINAGFLRGNLTSRLADVSQVVGLVSAWVAAAIIATAPRGAWRLLARVAMLLVAVCAFLSIDAIEGVRGKLRETDVTAGVSGMRACLARVVEGATAVPPVDAWAADTDGIERLARYVNRCTEPSDRLLAVAYTPELYFMAARAFAGGHVWLQPGYFTSAADQALMIERLHAHRVPIVVTVPEPMYTDEYVHDFPALTAALATEYRSLGEVDLGRDRTYRVLVRGDLTPAGVYAPLGLPCFAAQE